MHNLFNNVITSYQYIVFGYTTAIVIFYFILVYLAKKEVFKYNNTHNKVDDKLLEGSPFTPGISIIAPAYNEEKTIILNVNSMLTVDYPIFEVVIVNDGSTDRTLELMIEEFDLVETPFAYIEKIRTKPFKRILKSTNPKYSRLTVVDKENGGTKSDASNAGINAAAYPYFICTDVDCILSEEALSRMIQPILQSSTKVIAVGATMRMANNCEVTDEGRMNKVKLPKTLLPMFQEIEYLRSYMVGKMGWSAINAMPNISGGLGLFDKSVVIAAGGYDPLSHAEDMDITARIIAYMRDFNKDYKIVHIPFTCCWTEGPPTLKIFNRQRTRWARGLLQFFIVHRKFLFNRKYGRMGMISFPFVLIFEFLAPIIEAIGLISILLLAITGNINWDTFFLMLGYAYIFGLCLSLCAIFFDLKTKIIYHDYRDYFKMALIILIEPIVYHPLIVFFSLKGYINFLTSKKFEWGQMTRQGFDRNTKIKNIEIQNA